MPSSDRRPHRQGSRESAGSRKHRRDLESLVDNLSEVDLYDHPPQYEEVEKPAKPKPEDHAEPPAVEPASISSTTLPSLSTTSRIIWPIVVLLPLIASGVLLYLVTSSRDTFRTSFPALTVSLPQGDFEALYAAAPSTGSNSSSGIATPMFQVLGATTPGTTPTSKTAAPTTATSLSLKRSRRANATQFAMGQLSIGFWGWCLQPKRGKAEQLICSDTSAWFNLEDLFTTAKLAPTSSLRKGFNAFLLHCLLFHGAAILTTMLSLVPVSVHMWKRYIQNNPVMEAGWFQHGTLFIASLMSLAAWISDSILQMSSADRLPSLVVKSGLGSTFSGVSALLLFISLLASGIPVLLRHLSRQRRYVKYWSDVEDVGEEGAARRLEEERIAKEEKRRRREKQSRSGRSKGRRERMKRRMTRWFGYDEDHSDRPHRSNRSRRR